METLIHLQHTQLMIFKILPSDAVVHSCHFKRVTTRFRNSTSQWKETERRILHNQM